MASDRLHGRVLVTGGAGFIGNQLCKALLKLGEDVTVLDNFSSGARGNLELSSSQGRFNIIKGDCKNKGDVKKALAGVKTVFHFAANPEVRLDRSDPSTCFRENIYATHILLEAIKNADVETIVFASSSTVYGDARLLPTPENYGPLEPISYYGAAKLGSEGLISAHCHTYRRAAVILRLANIIGPMSKHGVIRDFLTQVKNNPRKLRILGDGNQTKSYLFIDDCISAILRSVEFVHPSVNIFNVGSEDQIIVKDIAKIILGEAGLNDVTFEFTRQLEEGRGWNGDVKRMLLDVRKLRSKGWRPKFSSEDAVRITVKSLLRKSLHFTTELMQG